MEVELTRDDDPDRKPAAWEAVFDALCEVDRVLAQADFAKDFIPASEAADLALDLRQAVRRLLDEEFRATEQDLERYR